MGLRVLHGQYDGFSSTTHIVSGFVLKELFFEPGATIPKHSHETANFCITINGACDESHGTTHREFNPLTWDYFPAGVTHSLAIHPRAGMQSFSIEIPPKWLDRAREYSAAVDIPLLSTGGTLGWLLLRLYREYKNIDEASPLTVEGLALEMLAEISTYRAQRTNRCPPQWLEQIKDYLHAHFSKSPHLSTLSAIVDVHPSHLAREFRKFYRCTIGEYVHRLRIEQACRDISLPDSSLAQIALTVGFSDQSHFSRIFKRQMGISPTEYRAIFHAR